MARVPTSDIRPLSAYSLAVTYEQKKMIRLGDALGEAAASRSLRRCSASSTQLLPPSACFFPGEGAAFTSGGFRFVLWPRLVEPANSVEQPLIWSTLAKFRAGAAADEGSLALVTMEGAWYPAAVTECLFVLGERTAGLSASPDALVPALVFDPAADLPRFASAWIGHRSGTTQHLFYDPAQDAVIVRQQEYEDPPVIFRRSRRTGLLLESPTRLTNLADDPAEKLISLRYYGQSPEDPPFTCPGASVVSRSKTPVAWVAFWRDDIGGRVRWGRNMSSD